MNDLRVQEVALSILFEEELSLQSIIAALVESRAGGNGAGYEVTAINGARKTQYNPFGMGGEIGVKFGSFEGAERFLAILRSKQPGK